MATGHQLRYMVEQWDDTDSHVEELIALTGDYRVARAAYEEAVKRRPGRIVTLRQKTRLCWRIADEGIRAKQRSFCEATNSTATTQSWPEFAPRREGDNPSCR